MQRVGFGYDIHRLVKGRKLLLAGIELPFERGEAGHSDGDVLIHAVIDGLLGAAALGDIGSIFPPEDPGLKDISSRILLKRITSLIKLKKLCLVNLDCTVVLEAPRIRPFVPLIRKNLAEDLEIDEKYISIKGKTKEGLDQTGRGEAVEAYAVVLVDDAGHDLKP